MTNNNWCTDVKIISSDCSALLEHLIISCRAFHLLREFTSVVITAVYIPPQSLADNNTALDQLFGIIDKTETSRPDAAFVVAGDFNTANMKKVLPKYYQHISCPTRGGNILNHVYSPFRHGYKALPRPPFGKSDHILLLLLPAYKQKLKRDRPVTRTVQRWSKESDSALQDCFASTDWSVFEDNNINTHTDTVICYIGKCIDDVVPKVTVQTFPNPG
ncbi:hypothetical protein OYC64_008335 [Pagothenia borchgrevinki]|uniref:Endonuclease/exonuclease/phosphatase domain-containing protein n=1 Tax=Pagothenia borchgrevinki TaxID=8213 RepID=A0ABD2G484_PAGBO